MRINYIYIILIIIIIAFLGCYGIRPSSGGGEVKTLSRHINPLDIALPKGYIIEAVSSGLTFPTGIAFDEQGQIYLVESGYSYGEAWTEPRLLKIDTSGKTSVIATGEKNGPWNGVTFQDENFYIAEGGVLNGGRY